MNKNIEENLISIDEIIFRAKKLGIDFGKGNPKERLRYLTKLGLLPHAKRKSFNGEPPNGAYPEYTVELLKEIDDKIKSGKTIQEIKKEKEREKLSSFSTILNESLSEIPFEISLPISLPTNQKGENEKEREVMSFDQKISGQEKSKESKVEIPKIEKIFSLKIKPFFKKTNNILKVVFFILILGGIIFFLNESEVKKNFSSYLFAALGQFQKLTQAPTTEIGEAPIEEASGAKEILFSQNIEPYLTINAETDINGPLKIKEMITTPAITFTKGDFKAEMSPIDLTADRSYAFPDSSGTVCLTSGNCVGLGGEVLMLGDGIPNRLIKFINSKEIEVSSINDFYTGGVALTVDTFGNIGIGTAEPAAKLDVAGELIASGNIISYGKIGVGTATPNYPLQVKGRIQATGDICTDLGGGKCLSQLALVYGGGGGGGGISGSGSVGYIPLWTSASGLGNSIITQLAADKIGIAGTVKVLGFELPTGAQPGYVLTADATTGIASWQSPPSGTLPSGANFLRGAISIFRFPIPSQTNATNFLPASVRFDNSNWQNSFPSVFSGATRKYAFLIKIADDINSTASSSWRVYRPASGVEHLSFTFCGQSLSSLEEGFSFLSDLFELPDNDWQLEVKLPSPSNTMRIFEILLLAYDEI